MTDENNVAKELRQHNNFEKLKSVVNHLKGESLIDGQYSVVPPLGILKITQRAVTEIERTIPTSEKPTEHFSLKNVLKMIPQTTTIITQRV